MIQWMMACSKMPGRQFGKNRFHLPADICGIGAARMKFATLWRTDRTWNIPFQQDRRPFSLFRSRNRGEQSLGVRMVWCSKKLRRGSQLYKAAEVHNADAVRNIFYDAEIVGNEKIGQVIPLFQFPEKVQDLGLDGHVKS